MDTGVSLTIADIIRILGRFSNFLFDAAYGLCVIFIIVAGVRYMLAGGNAEKIGDAKKNFSWVLIGVLVIFAVNVIINSVAAAVGSPFRISPF